jgi:hypothetical protein
MIHEKLTYLLKFKRMRLENSYELYVYGEGVVSFNIFYIFCLQVYWAKTKNRLFGKSRIKNRQNKKISLFFM